MTEDEWVSQKDDNLSYIFGLLYVQIVLAQNREITQALKLSLIPI